MKWPLYFLCLLLLACAPDTKGPSDSAPENTAENPASDAPALIRHPVEMLPISTPVGDFRVFTQRIGDSPSKRVLLLHGGPGGTYEFFKCFEDHLPQEGIEFIYYDQLGSTHSDQPMDTSLWNIPTFVNEVEQVRQALGLDTSNFYLYGQSWGGILAAEYALAHQDKLKGLIISNMVMSIPEYTRYAHEVLGPAMPDGVYETIMEIEAKGDFSDPRYMELLMEHHYAEHILRMPLSDWSADVDSAFAHLNFDLYVYMQGQSEFGVTEGATLQNWDITDRLPEIAVPTLSIGATYDSMDPVHMKWIAQEVQNGRFLLCPNGSHLSQYDDPEHFFPGLIQFIHDVDTGEF